MAVATEPASFLRWLNQKTDIGKTCICASVATGRELEEGGIARDTTGVLHKIYRLALIFLVAPQEYTFALLGSVLPRSTLGRFHFAKVELVAPQEYF